MLYLKNTDQVLKQSSMAKSLMWHVPINKLGGPKRQADFLSGGSGTSTVVQVALHLSPTSI